MPRAACAPIPHQLSGGMRQRVAIAIALLNGPDLVIADEPTTALDVTLQAQILAEMQALARDTATAILWITHDLSVVAGFADSIAVMYAGRIVEQGEAREVLAHPIHPYTAGLIASVPGWAGPGARLRSIPGLPPLPGAAPSGCPFRDRCRRRLRSVHRRRRRSCAADRSPGAIGRCPGDAAAARTPRDLEAVRPRRPVRALDAVDLAIGAVRCWA